jgi:hypothetical protein
VSIADDVPSGPDPSDLGGRADVADEERMLVTIRDTLYEGSWVDFVRDLERRLEDEPYVFDIHPATPRLKETIRHHLALIEGLRGRDGGPRSCR